MLMSLIKIMKREQILLRLVVLIFIGGAINAAILVFSIEEITRDIQSHPFTQNQIPFITTSPHVTIIYIILGIVFSLGASVSFTPKRIVSPLYVQLTTATILIIVLNVYNFVLNPTLPLTLDFVFVELVIIFMFYGILGGVGWMQQQFVRRILGVNGGRENIDYQTYSLNVRYDDILKVINRRFLDRYDLNKKRSEDMLLLQSKWGMYTKHVIVIIPDPDHDTKSILSITSYQIRFDWLTIPRDASGREAILGGLERMLKLTNQNVILIQREDDKIATNNAITQTLKVTESPLGEIRNYPKRHILLFGAFTCVSTAVVLGYIFNLINGDTLTNVIVFLVIVFIVEAVPLLRERVRERITGNQN